MLDDIHINAAQALLKQQFPEIGGLCNTLLQNSQFNTSNTSISGYPSLQVIFVPMDKTGHWICLSTLGCKGNEVEIYDTLQNVPNLETQIIIGKYMKSKSSCITIKLINLSTQKGSADCGFYAIAIITTLVFGNDPSKIVYHDEMRPHLKQCFESGTIAEFPALQRRRIKERTVSIIECPIYCICRLPTESEDTVMIQCDMCQIWYHVKCLKVNPDMDDKEWFCQQCSQIPN